MSLIIRKRVDLVLVIHSEELEDHTNQEHREIVQKMMQMMNEINLILFDIV